MIVAYSMALIKSFLRPKLHRYKQRIELRTEIKVLKSRLLSQKPKKIRNKNCVVEVSMDDPL